jgi:hypothetical protein
VRNNYVLIGHFEARSIEGKSIAESSKFKFSYKIYGTLDGKDIEEIYDARQALNDLLDQLTRDGWKPESNKGDYWYSYILRR